MMYDVTANTMSPLQMAEKSVGFRKLMNTFVWICLMAMVIIASLWLGEGPARRLVSVLSEGATMSGLWALALIGMMACIGTRDRKSETEEYDSAFFFRLTVAAVLIWDVLATMFLVQYFHPTIAIITGMWVVTLFVVPPWWASIRKTFNRPLPIWVAWLPFLFLLLLIVAYGFPSGRSIGGTHSNMNGAVAAIGLLACVIARGRMNVLEFVFAFTICMLVQSRGAIILVAGFASFWFVLSAFARTELEQGTTRRFALVIVALLGFLAIFGGVVTDTLFPLLDNTFALTDVRRGLGSGFTGRVELWGPAISYGVDHPFSGQPYWYQGFEAIGHNGYISVIYQYGIVPAVLIFILMALRVFMLVVAAIRRPEDTVLRAVVAFILAASVYSIFEFWMLNLFKPVAVVVWIMMLYPLPTTGRRKVKTTDMSMAKQFN